MIQQRTPVASQIPAIPAIPRDFGDLSEVHGG